jgi:putative transposase
MYHRYHELYFTTATILEWKHLLKLDHIKDVIIDSFRYLVKEKKAVIYGFVIMPNHIHIIWHIPAPFVLDDVKAALLSFTAHQFKKILKEKHSQVLERFRVNLKDRIFQFWERNALSIEIYHEDVFYQKLRYIHNNPCVEKWNLADIPENYVYSSAYCQTDATKWDFVTPFI